MGGEDKEKWGCENTVGWWWSRVAGGEVLFGFRPPIETAGMQQVFLAVAFSIS